MRSHSWSLFAGLAIACSAAFAQQQAQEPGPRQPPAAQQPPPQTSAAQPAAAAQAAALPQQPAAPEAQLVQQEPASRAGPDEGFFRPAPDPVINPPPAPPGRSAANAAAVPPRLLPADVATSFAAQVEARESLERELDRAQRDNARAQAAEAARRPAPMIVSPLDGTAPIVSPLDR